MSRLSRALRTFDAASLTGSFQNVGSPIGFPSWRGTFINTSDVDVLITDQSSEDDIRVPANGTISISELIFSNSERPNKALFDSNVQLQIKQVTASGTGTIIIECMG